MDMRKAPDFIALCEAQEPGEEYTLYGYEYQDIEFAYEMLDTLYADGNNDCISLDMKKALEIALLILDDVYEYMVHGEPIKFRRRGQEE